MTMIEQVARALIDADPHVHGHCAEHIQMKRGAACLAIAAMREPTPGMCEAVVPFPEHLRAEHPDPADPWHRRMTAATLAEQAAAGNRYSRMIDAALAEKP